MLASISLVAASVPAQAACFTSAEWEAAHVRLLQLTLEDTTLQCANVPGYDFQTNYNNFMNRFHDQLLSEGRTFQTHFKRVYGRGASAQIDRYVTGLANDIQSRSMGTNTFCHDSQPMFQAAVALTPDQFAATALQQSGGELLGEPCKAHIVSAGTHKHGKHRHTSQKPKPAS